LLRHIQAGQVLCWTDVASVPDDAWTCTVFGMGSIAPHEPLGDEESRRLGYRGLQVDFPMATAVQELEAYTGVDIQVIVPFEPGAGNTPTPLDAATRLGKVCVDADYAGRAIPELAQTLAAIEEYPMWPAAICDPWGNRLIMKSAPSALIAERVGKSVSLVTRRPQPLAICAHAGYMMKAAEMKRLVVPGTLTLALDLGAAIRRANEAGQDPVEAARAGLQGWLLFTGTVTGKEWESREGYMFGATYLQGTGEFAGHTVKIWFQNENHVAWLDDAPYVTSPDFIMVVDRATAEPYTNTVLAEGQAVAVLGARADPRYRTERGLAVLGPGHFGFELPYRPIESVIG
jgi:DUF917 family protein